MKSVKKRIKYNKAKNAEVQKMVFLDLPCFWPANYLLCAVSNPLASKNPGYFGWSSSIAMLK